MTEIVPLDFEGAAVRMLVVDGEPWWLAVDAAAVLGIKNIHSSLALLDEDERGLHSMETPHGPQSVAIVSESGLYSLILRSRRPQAKAFKRWVTREVIPSIRKTGGYGVREMTKLEALRVAIESEEARLVAETRAQVAERRARELEPKAEAWDIFAQVRGDSLVADAAKHLSLDPRITIGSGRLFAKLHQLGWTFRAGDGRWRANQRAVDLGRLNEHITSYKDLETGEKKMGAPQVRVTIKGLYDLHRVLLAEADRRSYPALTLVELDAG